MYDAAMQDLVLTTTSITAHTTELKVNSQIPSVYQIQYYKQK